MERRASPSEPRLILATRNPGKLREITAVLEGLPYGFGALADLTPPVALPPEGERSYVENALAKARAVSAGTGALTLADDSGLEVDALGGAPGVRSARYGGEGKSDAERCELLLRALAGVPARQRTARFRAVVALSGPRGREAVVEGVVEGVIVDAPRGHEGFGYDPLFLYPPLGRTFAELSLSTKSAVSHRGRALAQAREILREWATEVRPSAP